MGVTVRQASFLAGRRLWLMNAGAYNAHSSGPFIVISRASHSLQASLAQLSVPLFTPSEQLR